MKSIIIRTLGGEEIGYGHFYRCLSLAKGINLLEKDIKILFIINEELVGLIKDTNFKFIVSNGLNEDFEKMKSIDIDLFILDSYLADNEYLKRVKKKTKLMLIDDNNDIYDSTIADILYNGNIHASTIGYPINKNQLQLLGSEYLIMREEYWLSEQAEKTNKEGILITTGGTDKYEIMLKIIDAIELMDVKIRVVIGPGYSDDYIKKIKHINKENLELIYKPNSLKEYINSSMIVITAGGSTVYEVLSQKITPIVFSMADNQDLICKTLNQMGVDYLGKYPNIAYDKLIHIINENYDKNINNQSKPYTLVTGKGIFRIVEEILGK